MIEGAHKSVEKSLADGLPEIIQGGMGVGVSGWRLARAVSEEGQLGVVSGTALDLLLTRQLQLGDPAGDLRRALAAFPDAQMAERVLDRYFIADGKDADAPFRTAAMVSHEPSRVTQELLIISSFVAIYLAKEGHSGVVGINLLEKIQPPTLLVLYGAMLAGVDVVLMGAGVPKQIPGVLDDLSTAKPTKMRLDVKDAAEPVLIHLNPSEFSFSSNLKRPIFLAIVSSPVLADNLKRKASGRVDGFVVESNVAGGHNAPPRGVASYSSKGEPIYGERDQLDPAKFVKLGLPFWLAGGFGKPGMLREAISLGAKGIQVGTLFALSEESGFAPEIKSKLLEEIRQGRLEVVTDPNASPTGLPIKAAQFKEAVTNQEVFEDRLRVCDLGILREIYENANGKVSFRCPAECADSYEKKGGDVSKTEGRVCLCNSLCSAVGIGQVRDGKEEPPFITLGSDLDAVKEMLSTQNEGYKAADAIRHLLVK